MFINVVNNLRLNEIIDRMTPPEGQPDLSGADVCAHGGEHEVDVVPVLVQNVRFVNLFLGLLTRSTENHDAVIFGQRRDVVGIPQSGRVERLQEVVAADHVDFDPVEVIRRQIRVDPLGSVDLTGDEFINLARVKVQNCPGSVPLLLLQRLPRRQPDVVMAFDGRPGHVAPVRPGDEVGFAVGVVSGRNYAAQNPMRKGLFERMEVIFGHVEHPQMHHRWRIKTPEAEQ